VGAAALEKTMTSSGKIESAQKATADIFRHLVQAYATLPKLEGRVVNDHGVLRDPVAFRIQLKRVEVELAAALERLDDAAWPTAADYAAVKGKGSQ
jgi:hypothetical protein